MSDSEYTVELIVPQEEFTIRQLLDEQERKIAEAFGLPRHMLESQSHE